MEAPESNRSSGSSSLIWLLLLACAWLGVAGASLTLSLTWSPLHILYTQRDGNHSSNGKDVPLRDSRGAGSGDLRATTSLSATTTTTTATRATKAQPLAQPTLTKTPNTASECGRSDTPGTWLQMPAVELPDPGSGEPPFYWNKHLVMVGDSRMRYQYVSLAYFFTHGTFATSKAYDSLASKNEQQFFSAWLQQVDQILKYDKCNCFRPYHFKPTNTVEHRYYRNPEKNMAITYLQKFGSSLMQGHWHSNGTSIDFCGFPCAPNKCDPLRIPATWTASNVSQLARVVAELKPDYVVYHPGWEELTGWAPEDVAQLFGQIQELCPAAKLYLKTRLLTWKDDPKNFTAWADKTYADMYEKYRFAEHGWHIWDVSKITAAWKEMDDPAKSFMLDSYHYTLRSNNELNRLMLQTLFGVDVR